MIKLLAKNYSPAVHLLCDKLQADNISFDILLTQKGLSAGQYLTSSLKTSAVIMVGNVGECSTLFADTFGLTMFYDSYAEKTIAEYCKLANIAMPAQHVLDRLCYLPESFNHYSAVYGYQCGCFGEYNKKPVYILPDDARECDVLYDNYLAKDFAKHQAKHTKYVFKVCGLTKQQVEKRLDQLNKVVVRSCQTENLDSKITLLFGAKCAKSVVKDTLEQFNSLFAENIYASCDQSLAKTLVQLLAQIGKTLSCAESITGGMLASSIVDVAGSSNVFYEGAVTYSSVAKSKRLSISPHYIDEYSAVSPQVAKSMVVGLLQNGTDVAIATTGYAGPDPEGKTPVGLCYIAIASRNAIKVHKNVFVGDRNSIRSQATNMAMFLAIKSITK